MNTAAHRSAEATHPHILWGTPHSLYTGKARSCLIKKGLAFLERCPSHPDYKARVRPAVGLVTFPVLETPEGQFIQDSTDIVTYLDALDQGAPAMSMTPATPVQLAVARLVDGFGLEGMLQVAMHYRWSYRDEQELFLQTEFGRGLYAGADREARRAAGRRVMEFFSSTLPALGITPQTIPVIEAAYAELLEALDVHFQSYPYVLGWRVSMADLGLIAPMYAHLGRDPYPTALMKKRAPNVARWVERMQLPNTPDGEYAAHVADWLPDDAIPATLEPVLALLFKDWGPQLVADAACYQQWLEAHPDLEAGHLINRSDSRLVHPTLGMVSYPWRGVQVQRASAMHGLWLFQMAQSAVKAMPADARLPFDALMQRTTGQDVLALRLSRPLERRNNVLVLQ
ncbi:MAG: glutathione S-transferase N-terminal domain-containing protein [Rhodoferax sp.]|nr:glutathione S-transferase N-terminal domain-containing protein [Rhodoferax sp.]